MFIVTSYSNPDIDGIACMYAYCEYLNHNDRPSAYKFFGEIHPEAQFIIKKFGIQIE
jgi:nanoRNase/pAp phosphatase (c-di-AMP/oligoRNAs hydrolase)